MGFIKRKTSGKISLNGRLIVPGQKPIMINPGGNTDINQKKGNTDNGTKR
jgi:hypothetical protein